jgi:2'-5' RNA ligase
MPKMGGGKTPPSGPLWPWLPDELMVKLKGPHTLASSQRCIRVRPGIHLRHLGDIESGRGSKVAEALFAAKGVKAFTLKAQGVAGSQPQVPKDHLGRDKRAIASQTPKHRRTALESGFEKDDRRSTLTWPCSRNPGAGRELGKRVEESKIDIDVDFRADYFVLFRSVLSPKGTSTELRRFDLE